MKIDFSLWLLARTDELKSTLAALFLSHNGDFDRTTLPGQWSSTANALERRAFVLKDGLFVVDDFAPPHNAQAAHELEKKAHRLIRAAGNRGGRQRLNADLSERLTYDPRCLIMATGEITPSGQSLAARYLVVEIERASINLAKLTAAQENKHLLAEAMSAFIHWVAPQFDELILKIRDSWEAYRSAARSKSHLRVPEMVAWLTVGFELFCEFQMAMGTIT